MATKLAAKPVKVKRNAAKSTAAPAVMAMAETAARIVAPAAAAAKPVEISKPGTAAKPANVPFEGTKTMTDAVKTVEDTVKKVAAEAGEKAQAFFADASDRAKTAFEKTSVFARDAADFNKANVEAMVESAKLAVKGMQTVAQHNFDYGRQNFDATTAMFKSAAGVKNPSELMKLQGDFAKSQFEGAVAQFSKSTELGLKLAGEIFQPIQNRYSVAVEQVKNLAA